MKTSLVDLRQRFVLVALLLLLAIAILCVAEAGAATVTIKWKDNSTDESGFRIERRLRKDAVTTYVQIGETAANVEAFDDATIATNIQYCYRVRGFNPVALSEYSNEACMMVTPSGTVVEFKSQ